MTKGKWSRDEDVLLAHLHTKLGSAWLKIAERIRGRTGWSCQQHWEVTLEPFIRLCLLSGGPLDGEGQGDGRVAAGDTLQKQRAKPVAVRTAFAPTSIEKDGPTPSQPDSAQVRSEDELRRINEQIQLLEQRKEELLRQQRNQAAGSGSAQPTASVQPRVNRTRKRSQRERTGSDRLATAAAQPTIETRMHPSDPGSDANVKGARAPSASKTTDYAASSSLSVPNNGQGGASEGSTAPSGSKKDLLLRRFADNRTEKEDEEPRSKRALLNWDVANLASTAKRTKRQ